MRNGQTALEAGELRGGDSTYSTEPSSSCCILSVSSKLIPLEKEKVYDVKQAVYEFVMVGAKGRGGSSPLHLACSRDTSSVGRYPICNFPSVPHHRPPAGVCGAPVDARDNDGNTPLHAAAYNTGQPRLESFRSLLQNGAHFDLVNNDKKPSIYSRGHRCMRTNFNGPLQPGVPGGAGGEEA